MRLLNTAMSVGGDFMRRECVARGSSEALFLFLNLEEECIGSWR